MFKQVYVRLKCPHCGHSLMDSSNQIDGHPAIKMDIYQNGKSGTIWMSAIYGSYNYCADIDVREGDVVKFSCKHCANSLVSKDVCSDCEAPMVDFHLVEGGRVMICSRSGCKKHLVEFEDIATALNHFYNQYEKADG